MQKSTDISVNPVKQLVLLYQNLYQLISKNAIQKPFPTKGRKGLIYECILTLRGLWKTLKAMIDYLRASFKTHNVDSILVRIGVHQSMNKQKSFKKFGAENNTNWTLSCTYEWLMCYTDAWYKCFTVGRTKKQMLFDVGRVSAVPVPRRHAFNQWASSRKVLYFLPKKRYKTSYKQSELYLFLLCNSVIHKSRGY